MFPWECLGLCVSSLQILVSACFSVYPLGVSAFARISTKAGASLRGQNPSHVSRRQARRCLPHPHHTWLPLLSPQPSLDPQWSLGRICFLVRACSSPSTSVWNFTMDSQAHGSSSGVDRKQGKRKGCEWLPVGEGGVVADQRQDWGVSGPRNSEEAERHAEFLSQCSQRHWRGGPWVSSWSLGALIKSSNKNIPC